MIEFPVLAEKDKPQIQFGCTGGKYAPGIYRVALDKDTKAYVGMMYHDPSDVNGRFRACTDVPKPKAGNA